jgi:uncharacterized protein with NRDE domain
MHEALFLFILLFASILSHVFVNGDHFGIKASKIVEILERACACVITG